MEIERELNIIGHESIYNIQEYKKFMDDTKKKLQDETPGLKEAEYLKRAFEQWRNQKLNLQPVSNNNSGTMQPIKTPYQIFIGKKIRERRETKPGSSNIENMKIASKEWNEKVNELRKTYPGLSNDQYFNMVES